MRYVYLQGMTAEGRMIFPHVSGGEDAVRLNGSEVIFYSSVFWADSYLTVDGKQPATPKQIAEDAFMAHNRDDRPRGREIRSMSCGDVVVVFYGPDGGGPTHVLFCDISGFTELGGKVAADLADVARRNAYGVVKTKVLFDAVAAVKAPPPRKPVIPPLPAEPYEIESDRLHQSPIDRRTFTAEASDLGLRAGQWPRSIQVKGGLLFYREKAIPGIEEMHGYTYRAFAADVGVRMLHVYND